MSSPLLSKSYTTASDRSGNRARPFEEDPAREGRHEHSIAAIQATPRYPAVILQRLHWRKKKSGSRRHQRSLVEAVQQLRLWHNHLTMRMLRTLAMTMASAKRKPTYTTFRCRLASALVTAMPILQMAVTREHDSRSLQQGDCGRDRMHTKTPTLLWRFLLVHYQSPGQAASTVRMA